MCGVIQVDLVDYNRLTDLASLKNELSLKFTLWNIESAAIPIQKKIAAHAWVHQPFGKVLILGHLR